MTQLSQHLTYDSVETPQGKKAVLFQYRMLLLPDGNLQSSITNVDPDVIIKFFNESNMEPETTHIVASAIRHLVRESEEWDKKLSQHINAL